MKFKNHWYKHGETRERRRFAWLPVRLNNDIVIWLERYYIKEVMHRDIYGGWWHTLKIWQETK